MILLAGGSGHLGSELVPLLRAHKIGFRVLTRNLERTREKLGADAEFVIGDATDAARLARVLNGIETVISTLTGFGVGGRGPVAVDYQANVNLIRAAEAAGVRRFMLLSMHGARPDHAMQLLRMKYRAEEVLRASGLQWVIIRPTIFAELWAGIIGDPIVKSGKATLFGRGDNPINFVSTRDVAVLIQLALNSDTNQTIDVGGPENLTLKDVVNRIGEASGRKPRTRHIPLWLLRVSRSLAQPFRADLAGFAEAAISMATEDMTFDARELQKRIPNRQLRSMTEVIDRKFGGQQQVGNAKA